MTLKQAIKNLISRSTKTTLVDGTVEYYFAGNVHWAVREAIWSAYRNGELTSRGQSHLGASRDDCHVAFYLGQSISTQNYVRFSYVDERVPARQFAA